jgi:hypothetical protein
MAGAVFTVLMIHAVRKRYEHNVIRRAELDRQYHVLAIPVAGNCLPTFWRLAVVV